MVSARVVLQLPSIIWQSLGLRSMFFLIVGMLEKFRFIHYSLAIILGFVGLKMLALEYIHIPIYVSLTVIALALTVGILASIWITPKKGEGLEIKEYADEQEKSFRELDEQEEKDGYN